ALRYTVRAVVIGAAIILGACPRMITDSGYVLTISPAAANVFVNDTTRFTATLRDKNGAAVSTPLSWSVDNTSIAQVDTTGTVHAAKAGSATVEARARGLMAAASITVLPKPSSVVLVGAGDISTCSNQGDSATAKIIEGISGTVAVFVAGDNAYPDGSAADYANCYDPTWGRFKSRTHPAPGNHDHNIPGASGYFGYLGSPAA